MENNYSYNPDQYWQDTEDSYPHYPTVRHRKRFMLRQLRKHFPDGNFSVFDFGCGEGTLLKTVQDAFDLENDQIGGCDISQKAIAAARRKLGSPHLTHDLYPPLGRSFDVMLCSEVLEHTAEYETILRYMQRNLAPGGMMMVTTQAGRIHASDRYTGHTQHFRLQDLTAMMERTGLGIVSARLWGWPLFTLQKYLTNLRFNRIQKNYLEGKLTLRKQLVFMLAYGAYFVHDLLPLGPQIYVVARNGKSQP